MLALLLAALCQGQNEPPAEKAAKVKRAVAYFQLKDLGAKLVQHVTAHKVGPKSLDTLEALFPKGRIKPFVIRDIEEGNYLVYAGFTIPNDPKKAVATVIAYEQKTPKEGGWAVFADGSVKEVAAGDFGALAKASGTLLTPPPKKEDPLLKNPPKPLKELNRKSPDWKLCNAIGMLWQVHDQNHKEPTKSIDDLRKAAQQEPYCKPGLKAVESGRFIFIHGVRHEDAPLGTFNTIIAYEKEVPKKGGLVATMMAGASRVTPEEFRSHLPKNYSPPQKADNGKKE